MGSFRTRVKKKGKRWIKGQSSISNPANKTFRNSALNTFFRDDSTRGNQNALTVESVKRHNDVIGTWPVINEDAKSVASQDTIADAESSSSYAGTVKTYNTFASEWSCCSNVSFNKFINRFDLSSAHHKEMLAVLAAVTEVIKANGGQENNTEYFAALMTTLDGINLEEGNDDSVSAILSLLSMSIKTISKEILQLKFSAISKTLMRFLKHYADSDNNIILKSLLGCLSIILRAQEAAVWNDSSTFTIYDAILAFIVHTKSKIRKAGQRAVCAILKGSDLCKNKDIISHPAAGHTGKYCIQILENSISEGGMTTVLHILFLLKEIIVVFPKPQLKLCCETVLKLMTLKNTLITSCGLQTLYGLFVFKPSIHCCPPTLNAQLITALYDYQPSVTDAQPMIAWLSVMQEAFSNLATNDLSLCILSVPKFILTCTAALLSEKPEVINNATLSMQVILKDCVGPAATDANIERYQESVQKIFEILSNCLKYQYHAAWKQILYLLSTMYKVCGKTCHHFMMKCLKTLADLRDSDEFPYENEVDQVFGSAIESFGSEIIIKEIPLQVVNNSDLKHEIKRSWLLPLLKQHIKHSTLKCFVDLFLPMAKLFREKSEALNKTNDKVGAVTYDLLQSQIWALLPSFCNDAQDIKETFPAIAPPLGNMLTSRKDLRTTVMAALRRLINTCMSNEKDVDIMARFAKNYLPLLFNLYTTECKGTDEEATRVAALDTIKVYLSISGSELLQDLFNRALQKLESEEAEKSDFMKESILDLIRLLLPYQPTDSLKLLFEKHIVKVKDKKKFKKEKKYYRLLEDLCSCRSEGCNEYIMENFSAIKNLLLTTVSAASLPSRGPRMRTAKALLSYDSAEEIILEFLPEAVMCCKDGNKRCRFNAFELVTHMANLVAQNHGEAGFGRFLDAICAGLVGSTSMIAASILALSSTIHCCKDKIIKEQFEVILNNICILVKSKTREIVGPALGFLKLVISMNNPSCVVEHLQLIVKTLSNISDDCKRKFRQKIRDLYDRLMRKYGAATIIPMVPTHDGTTLVRLKALRKLQDRKNKKKQELREQKTKKNAVQDDESMFSVKRRPKTMTEILAECDSDEALSEEDSDDEPEIKKHASRKQRVYLKEDEDSIIDFTSPSANQNITTKKPVENSNQLDMGLKKKKKVEFPTAPDGRLIIREDKAEKLPSKDDINSDDESIASDAEAEGRLSNLMRGVEISKKRKFDNSDDEDEPSKKYQAGGSGIHRKIKGNFGEEYKAKKAKGDVKKRGKPDPYAYIPLSRNSLNRRKKKKAAGRFKNIVQKRRG